MEALFEVETAHDSGTLYTLDWAAFSADGEKVRDEFEGNVIDLGTFRLQLSYLPQSNKNNPVQDPSTIPLALQT